MWWMLPQLRSHFGTDEALKREWLYSCRSPPDIIDYAKQLDYLVWAKYSLDPSRAEIREGRGDSYN